MVTTDDDMSCHAMPFQSYVNNPSVFIFTLPLHTHTHTHTHVVKICDLDRYSNTFFPNEYCIPYLHPKYSRYRRDAYHHPLSKYLSNKQTNKQKEDWWVYHKTTKGRTQY
mmetsp:Transcript_7604/g.10920  ORF Transcript_7604/g.10920 Transcript_7604/m.10920 type:complete len:110 (-) Transcript_7604:197-526(-)